MFFTGQAVSGVATKDRRAKLRFPLAVELEYAVAPFRGIPRLGRGLTVNLSASGVLFRAEQPVPVGRRIRFTMAWPVLLGQDLGLRLVGHGRTVRAEGDYVAIEILGWDFRAARSKNARLAGRAHPTEAVQ